MKLGKELSENQIEFTHERSTTEAIYLFYLFIIIISKKYIKEFDKGYIKSGEGNPTKGWMKTQKYPNTIETQV